MFCEPLCKGQISHNPYHTASPCDMSASCSNTGQNDTAEASISNILDDLELLFKTSRHGSVRRTSGREIVYDRHLGLEGYGRWCRPTGSTAPHTLTYRAKSPEVGRSAGDAHCPSKAGYDCSPIFSSEVPVTTLLKCKSRLVLLIDVEDSMNQPWQFQLLPILMATGRVSDSTAAGVAVKLESVGTIGHRERWSTAFMVAMPARFDGQASVVGQERGYRVLRLVVHVLKSCKYDDPDSSEAGWVVGSQSLDWRWRRNRKGVKTVWIDALFVGSGGWPVSNALSWCCMSESKHLLLRRC